MYPHGSSRPDHFKYDMSFQSSAGEGGTSRASHSDINEHPDPTHEFSPVQGHIVRSSSVLLPQTHSQIQPTLVPEILSLVSEQTYSGMPDLYQHSHLHPAAHTLTFDSFERSTAASEYSYSDADYDNRHVSVPVPHYGSHIEIETYMSNTSSEPARVSQHPYVQVHRPTAAHRHSYHTSFSSPSDPSLHAPSQPQQQADPRPTPHAISSLSNVNIEAGTYRKQRTRKPFEPDRRLEVRRVRQTGACFRCRWLKKPCGIGTPCPQCINVKGRVWTYPCMRVNMTDVAGLSDLGVQNSQRSFLSHNIMGWAGAEATIQLTHGFSSVLAVVVEQAIPRDTHALLCKWQPWCKTLYGAICRWFEGSTSYLESPTMPYAINSFQISDSQLDLYLDCDRGAATANASTGTYSDTLVGLIFTRSMMRAAWDYAEITDCQMIKKALRVKTATCFQNYLLQCSGSSEIIVAPAFVQVQLDLVIDGRRAELEKEVLAELQKTVFSRKKKHWLSIFFTIYILLTSLEETLWSHYAWRTKGLPPTEFSDERAQEMADVLISVYRAINQGSQPFVKFADGNEVSNSLGDEYGDRGTSIFEAVKALISAQAPLLVGRKECIFSINDKFSLEGRFSSTLIP